MARPKIKKMNSDLREAARVAGVMVDGELAKKIISERAMHHIGNPNPRFKHMTGDYYDVDHDNFLLMKKTLLRLGRLVGFPCGTSLWVTVPGKKNEITCAVQNLKLHRYYRFGAGSQPAAPEMRRCLKTGKVTPAPAHVDYVTVFAPVRDSLGDVVGVVEFCSPNPKSKKLAPAWS